MEEGPHETSFHEHFWQQRLIGTKRQIRGGGIQLFRRKANKAGLLLKGTARWGRGTLHGLLFKHPCGAAFWGRRHEKGGREGVEVAGRWMYFVLQGQPGEMGEPGEKVSCGVSISSWSRTALPAKWPKSLETAIGQSKSAGSTHYSSPS